MCFWVWRCLCTWTRQLDFLAAVSQIGFASPITKGTLRNWPVRAPGLTLLSVYCLVLCSVQHDLIPFWEKSMFRQLCSFHSLATATVWRKRQRRAEGNKRKAHYQTSEIYERIETAIICYLLLKVRAYGPRGCETWLPPKPLVVTPYLSPKWNFLDRNAMSVH